MGRKLTQQEALDRANSVHSGFYDYSETVFNGYDNPINIICPTHGSFTQKMREHLSGYGCQKCGKIKNTKNMMLRRKSRRPDLSHIETPPGSKAVPVGTKGDYALVDEEDYERVMEHNWYNATGYAMNDVVGMMHRFIMGVKDRKLQVDHIFHNTLDNRKGQLRVCTRRQNMCNRGPDAGSSSVYKGVAWDKRSGKWTARIADERGKSLYLGLFTDEIEAAHAYDEVAKKHHKDFAWLNFPNGKPRQNIHGPTSAIKGEK